MSIAIFSKGSPMMDSGIMGIYMRDSLISSFLTLFAALIEIIHASKKCWPVESVEDPGCCFLLPQVSTNRNRVGYSYRTVFLYSFGSTNWSTPAASCPRRTQSRSSTPPLLKNSDHIKIFPNNSFASCRRHNFSRDTARWSIA